MSLTEILTILAIIFGPIGAVQIQMWIEKYKEKRNRKLFIFKTLMATRGARVSFEHVRALNMIDIEFNNERKVVDAWKCYLDCLSTKVEGDTTLENWAKEKDSLFVDLLSEMAESLGYHFNKVHLKKAIYIPEAHGQEEEYQRLIRDSIKKIFSGDQAISMKVVSFPPPSAEALKKTGGCAGEYI